MGTLSEVFMIAGMAEMAMMTTFSHRWSNPQGWKSHSGPVHEIVIVDGFVALAKKSGPIFLGDEAVNPGVIFLRWWEIWTSNQLRHPMKHCEQASSYTIDKCCSTMPWKIA